MKYVRGPASAGPLIAMVMLLIVLVAGCAAPWAKKGDESVTNDGLPEAMGEPAIVLTPSTVPVSTTPASGSPTSSTPRATSGKQPTTASTVAAAPATTAAVATAGPNLSAAAEDRSGDAGLSARGYADASRVEIADRGPDAIVTVTLVQAVPPRLADGEVMGIGVDIFRSNDKESDYQLFATGRVDGWTAYLDTPDGFVQYPGSFVLDGAQLRFAVPWSKMGGHTGGRFSSFVDWSKASVAVVAQQSADRVPDDGLKAFPS